jgi:hypothetical protein
VPDRAVKTLAWDADAHTAKNARVDRFSQLQVFRADKPGYLFFELVRKRVRAQYVGYDNAVRCQLTLDIANNKIELACPPGLHQKSRDFSHDRFLLGAPEELLRYVQGNLTA